jgi:hypothetical protein
MVAGRRRVKEIMATAGITGTQAMPRLSVERAATPRSTLVQPRLTSHDRDFRRCHRAAGARLRRKDVAHANLAIFPRVSSHSLTKRVPAQPSGAGASSESKQRQPHRAVTRRMAHTGASISAKAQPADNIGADRRR